jgi:hypothetical protein
MVEDEWTMPITRALLIGVGWRQSVAAVVENTAHEDGWRGLQFQCSRVGSIGKFCLHGLEQ